MFPNLLISYLIILFLPTLITKKIHAVDHMKNDFHKMLLSSNAEQYSSMKHAHKESAKITHRDDIQQGNRSPKDHLHQVIIACKHRNIDVLESMLFNVSNPYHQDYGKFLSDDQVKSLTSNPESVKHIQKYLEYNGIQILNATLNMEYMVAEATISKWEIIFNTLFYEFTSKSDPLMKFHRALSYSLPNELEHHVSNVFNTVQIPDIQYTNIELRKKSLFRKEILIDSTTTTIENNSDIDNNNSNKPHKYVEIKDHVTPALLSRVYNIPSNLGDGYGSQAIYSTIGQTYSPSDLTYFQKYFQITVENVAVDIGGHAANNACQKNQGQDCGEANLDVQYIMATAQKVPTTYYYWAGDDFLLDWILEVNNMQKPPLVFSISYGADESYMSPSYAEEFDIAAMKLGIRGVTILASSGDDGAISSSARSSPMNCGYNPSFPATSPYVTSVGGTMGPEKGNPETVCQGDLHGVITSGGGFSTLYSTPSWQLSTMNNYFNKIGTDKGGIGSKAPAPGFNRKGRGYPDVSAVATEYAVVYNNKLSAVSGTSASSPFIAGLISLVNSARLKAGLSSLGWINPSLYMLDSSTFIYDVVEGTNNCVAMGKVCCAQGFSAVEGWDPTTGLGSIDFGSFKAALMNIGNSPNSPTLNPTIKPGMPTPPPTIAPTNTPTNLLSQAPTIGAGWMSLEQYTKTNCEGVVTVVSGVATGQCFVEYDNTQNPIGSIQYTCDNEKATALYYSDNYCHEKFLVGTQYYGLGCAMYVEDTYYSDNPYSTSLSCSIQSSEKNMQFVPPVPDGIVPYAMQSSYDSLSGCVETAISEYTLYLENYCFDIADQGYSYMISFPKVIFYPAPKCISKKPETDSLPTTCEAVSTDDYGSYYQNSYYSYQSEQGTVDLYEVWSELHGKAPVPSQGPTISPSGPSCSPSYHPSYNPTISPTGPSFRPTYHPSLIPVPSGTTLGENIEITIQQLLDGLDLHQYRKNKDSGDVVLKHALAACLLLIQPTDISIQSIIEADIEVQDHNYLRSHYNHKNNLIINKDSLQHFLILSYTINFNTFEVGYTSSSSAYKAYLQQLDNALINGVFDSFVHQYAIIFNVDTMQSVSTPTTTKPIISSRYTSTLNTGSSDITDSSISSFLIGIIISMIAVAIIGIILYFNRNKQLSSSLISTSSHMDNTSNHTLTDNDSELPYNNNSSRRSSSADKQQHQHISLPRRIITRTSNAIRGTSKRMIRSSKKLIQQATTSTKNKKYKDRIKLSQEDNDDDYNDMVEIQLNESVIVTSSINPISSSSNLRNNESDNYNDILK